MGEKSRHSGLDAFRLLAALLVIAIHTSPLTTYTMEGDFLLTRGIARVAVPFFFMVTGHFVLGGYLAGKDPFARVWRQVKKILLVYLAAVLLYLPIGFYAGHYQDLTPLSALRLLLFDGTFYHLWYFPGCAMGLLLVCLLGRVKTPWFLPAATGLLYLAGLFGDSYYGLTARIPALAGAYEGAFHLFSYTRNGLFMAPLFLFLGAVLGRRQPKGAPAVYGGAFLLLLALMTGEAFILRHFALQRHDSMYLFLPLVMAALYQLLLTWRPKAPAWAAPLSTLVYILHPAMIVAVRGVADALGLTELLVENSLVHYLAVTAGAFLASALLLRIRNRFFPPKQRSAPPRTQARAWVQVEGESLGHNARALQALLPPGCTLLPVLKADAYGHGGVWAAKVLSAQGFDRFCVACADEAVRLREGGVSGEILILGCTHPSQFPLLVEHRLTQTVVDLPYARELEGYGLPLPVHLAIDTGMHRLGIPAGELDQILEVFAMKNLRVQGIFSHLCTADGADEASRAYVRRQAKAWRDLLDALKARGIPLPKTHLLASHGILNYPALAGDYARAGIALYGLLSRAGDLDRAAPDLRPVLSLRARVAAVRELEAGQGAGYGLAFTAQRPTRLAVLTIGYADGLPRNLEGAQVLLHGCRAPIVGRVCMDQTFVDVTALPPVAPGDVATLIGADGGETISAQALAGQAGTITNDLLSRLGPRLERVTLP